MTEKQKRILVAIGLTALALSLPVALAVIGGTKVWRESKTPQLIPEHSAALKEAAERAADAALPVPTLASDAVVVECAPEELEAQVQRVVRLSGGVGGAASSWNDGSTIRIIAKIPADSESVFRDAVTRGIYDMKIAQGSDETTVVEVLIKPTEKKPDRAKKKS
jgi:nucleotide-binding universal stress UspA family protein